MKNNEQAITSQGINLRICICFERRDFHAPRSSGQALFE